MTPSAKPTSQKYCCFVAGGGSRIEGPHPIHSLFAGAFEAGVSDAVVLDAAVATFQNWMHDYCADSGAVPAAMPDQGQGKVAAGFGVEVGGSPFYINFKYFVF